MLKRKSQLTLFQRVGISPSAIHLDADVWLVRMDALRWVADGWAGGAVDDGRRQTAAGICRHRQRFRHRNRGTGHATLIILVACRRVDSGM
jgi:hypothetical protein